MNKKLILFLFITLFAFGFAVYQYVKEFQSEFASATGTKPVNGHLWSEMECDSSGLCVKSDGSVGIGTDSPSKKLEVNGDILASGTHDICNGSGKCLSSVFQTNVIAGTNPTCPTGQTAIAKMNGSTWYDASQSSWTKVMCGQVMSSDGTALLFSSNHTSKNCTDGGGTVVSDGTYSFCRFNTSSCPSQWTKYGNWTTTVATQMPTSGTLSCPSTYLGSYSCPGCPSGTTSYHAWANTGTEIAYPSYTIIGETATCSEGNCWDYHPYCSCGTGPSTAFCANSTAWAGLGEYGRTTSTAYYATITQIGCY